MGGKVPATPEQLLARAGAALGEFAQAHAAALKRFEQADHELERARVALIRARAFEAAAERAHRGQAS